MATISSTRPRPLEYQQAKAKALSQASLSGVISSLGFTFAKGFISVMMEAKG
jgi:hypothetical protein